MAGAGVSASAKPTAEARPERTIGAERCGQCSSSDGQAQHKDYDEALHCTRPLINAVIVPVVLVKHVEALVTTAVMPVE